MAGGDELSRIDSFQYPTAHLGHLTEGQQQALDAFKKICADSGYYTPGSPEPGEDREATHDDETLLRYLRARRFNPKEAFAQFKDTEDWRKENNLDRLYDTISVDEYEQTRRLYPQWTGRRDRRGIPVYLFEVAHLNSKAVSEYTNSTAKSSTAAGQPANSKVPTKMLRLFALYENLTRFVMPLCSAIKERNHPETPISQSNNIVDISRVSLKQFWNLKNHMQDASTLATAHYPETLDRIFIIGAPAFFPTVWGWIKRWFDPITVSKIFILTSSNTASTLQQYIDPANIPKKYGGELDFEFGMMPVLEPDIAAALQWQNPSQQNGINTIPTGPVKWEMDAATGQMQAVACGSGADGALRHTVVATLRDAGVKALRQMHGSLTRQNTQIDASKEPPTGVGTDTQPSDELAAAAADEGPPPSGTTTPSGAATTPSDRSAANVRAAVVVPVQGTEGQQPAGREPVEQDEPGAAGAAEKADEQTRRQAEAEAQAARRAGTSETRYAAQDATHAAGQLASGTPAVTHHGHGDKTAQMEPGTVGQAAKERPLPENEDAGEASGGVVASAKSAVSGVGGMVARAGEAVRGAVGGKGEEKEEDRKEGGGRVEGKGDERVERAEDGKVEGFLRSRTTGQEVPVAEAVAK
ncbi:CRAL-TRIO domain-containing protein [Lineolata rhizophorae]|uniref:CRAL-TRIO domain-containing protein n=1 Tax=Lineolata rhizophorae TaxID=578093 RepID=A0A6A6P5Q5_9PEZI|nr:CRAL-TRIO domain-containing protein [Lineolata rhizophorae]